MISTAPRLRPYQVAAQEAIVKARQQGFRAQLISCATGLGKCVDPDTFVWSGGLRRFSDIWTASSIAGPHGTDEVTGWYDDGVNPGLRVETRAGFAIDGTLAHRIWIRRADGFEGWCRLDALRIGDYVALARGRADFGSTVLDPEVAYVLGLGIADGCLVRVNKNSNGTSHRFQIDGHPRAMARIAPTLERWRGKSTRHQSAMIHAPRLRMLFEDRFLVDWTYSEHREVPEYVLSGTRETVAAFLRGYFDGDGYANPIPAVGSASELLARQVQHLLLGLGVFCGLRKRDTTGGLPSWIVSIYDIDAFAREVGFTPYGLEKDLFFRARLAE